MRINSKFIRAALVALCAVTGCGPGPTLPLDIRLGTNRAEVISALAERDYCRTDAPVRTTERFRQCDGPGAKRARSWVVVTYKRKLVSRVQRFERHESPDHAAERWHALVAARRKIHGPPSDIARQRLLQIRGLPASTIAWSAWHSSDFQTLVGVYLLQPGTGNNVDSPDVLEEIIPDPENQSQ